jgi:hypothetical protein
MEKIYDILYYKSFSTRSGVRTHASMTGDLKSPPLDQLGHPCMVDNMGIEPMTFGS